VEYFIGIYIAFFLTKGDNICTGGVTMNKFAKNLTMLRNGRDITQEVFAETFGVSRSTIGMWESGKREPNMETLARIADYFNVDVNVLYGAKPTQDDYARWEKEFNPNGELAKSVIMHNLQKGGGGNISVQFDEYVKNTFGVNALALLTSFSKLNEQGKDEAVKRINEMVHIADYAVQGSSSVQG
jgi:DNA-binding XRE family transcriptional regulator